MPEPGDNGAAGCVDGGASSPRWTAREDIDGGGSLDAGPGASRDISRLGESVVKVWCASIGYVAPAMLY